ncbi:MAG: inositol monophosphatase [Chloroflexi bacterium]|nr:inositol monophosphatase [Chloroflexota bacterium]
MDAAIAAARAGGEILRAGFGQAHEVHNKGPNDIVTEADRAAETRIISILHCATPRYGFLTEESGSVYGNARERWIVDPLDGTVNYSEGYPCFCVSIGLESDGQLQLGVIYDPLRDELFAAFHGEGATLNEKPLRVSQRNSLDCAVISTGFPYEAKTSADDNSVEVRYFVKRAMSLRSTGSTALDLATIASGRRDAHWERGLSPYDVAAGIVLVREAGGVVTDYAGNPDAVYKGEIIAANAALHRQMLDGLIDIGHIKR